MSIATNPLKLDMLNTSFVTHPNPALVPPNKMISGATNINIDKNDARKRGGTSKVFSSALVAKDTLSIYDFRQLDGTQFVMRAMGDGSVYKDNTTSIKSSWSTTNFTSFATLNNYLFFCDSENTPQVWDGVASSSSDISNPNTDWSTNQPFQFLIHGRGLSKRMWALAGNTLYGSDLTDREDFRAITATAVEFAIEPSFGYQVTGMYEYGDTLFITSNNKTYILNDTDLDIANWGIEEALFEGGAEHFRIVVRAENTIYAMMDDGNIYNANASLQTKTDYRMTSVTRPAFIDDWIKNNIDLTQIAKFHAVYCPKQRHIKWFMVKTSSSACDVALTFQIDRPIADAWGTPHENPDFASGYNAVSSSQVRIGAGDTQVYTGDGSGFLWTTETATFNDDSNGYEASLQLPQIDGQNARSDKLFQALRVYSSLGSADDINLRWSVDGVTQDPKTGILLVPQGIKVDDDDAIVDSFFVGVDTVANVEIDLGAPGRRLELDIFESTANDDFNISFLIVDFKTLGNTGN